MMNLAEYRRSTTRLADFLPWAALVDEGIVLNKDGSFQRTARFRGPDLDSAVPAELVAVAGRLNNALASPRFRLGGVCRSAAVFSRTPIRRAVVRMWHRPWSMPSAEPNSRRRGLTTSSAYFLTFLYLPPAEDAARAERFLYEGRERGQAADAHEVLRGFVDRTDRVLQLVEGFMPECRWLDDGETLTYLHACVSTKMPSRPRSRDSDVSRCAAGRPAADRRARADAGRPTSARAHDCRVPDARPRRGSWTISIGLPSPIAGRPARSCSTRRTQRSS